jgi:hypothetical protein
MPPSSGDYSVRERQGSLENFHHHSTLPDGHVLNVLDLPLPDGLNPDEQLASDILAWKATMNTSFCKKTVQFPLHDWRWGLAATTSAQHVWHMDADGVCTSIEVKAGSKWWVVAKQKAENKDFVDLAHEENWHFEPYSSNECLSEAEGILLLPGTML